MLEAIFPRVLLKQEMCGERFLQIPEEVRDAYFKEEGVSTTCFAYGMTGNLKIEHIE
jgi:predicted alternative tryptophan synthase beta-subunit